MLLVAWLSAQGWWLYEAYQLEFQAKNTFIHIWFASIAFGFVNVMILCMIIYNYRQIGSAPIPAEKKND